jgi:surface polysaccharide O-acyltransferase-like enzyme
MMRVLRALPPQFALIVPATVILYLVSPLLAEGSVSGSSILIVFSFASILALPTITVVVLGGTSCGAGSVAATAIGAIFLV